MVAKSIINELNTKEIYVVVNIIICFHILAFYLQLILYYSIDYDLNIGFLLGGEGHRAFTDSGIYRPTGIFDEPAIFSIFCAGLVLIRLFYNRNLDWIILSSLISILLTLSFVGFLLASAILFIYSSMKIRLVIAFLMIVVITLIFSPLFSDNYIVNRVEMLINGDDASTNSKFLVISDFLSIERLFNFGYGYIGLRDWTPSYYDAIYDLTFYVTLLVEFGFYFGSILLFLFLYAVFTSKRKIEDIISFLVILVKLTATHFPFLWIVFAFFFSEDKSEDNIINS